MSLAHDPRHEPPERPHLRVIPGGREHVEIEPEGSPARGIVWGLIFAIGGFWVPLAAILGRRIF